MNKSEFDDGLENYYSVSCLSFSSRLCNGLKRDILFIRTPIPTSAWIDYEPHTKMDMSQKSQQNNYVNEDDVNEDVNTFYFRILRSTPQTILILEKNNFSKTTNLQIETLLETTA